MALTNYLTLGRSGLRISPFTLGTMGFGEDHGWGCSPEEAHRILSAYLDHGGNAIDTANIYTNGHSEKIIGDYLAARPGLRDRLVLGTKFFWNLHAGDPNGGGPGRKAIISQLDDSLRRLRTEYVDLYWLHNFDPVTPVEETLRALDDLVTAGKIRYVGFSDVPAWATAEAATIARLRGWAPVTALQLEYSLLERTSEGELMPLAEALGLGVLAWGPLKSGFLSGKYSSDKAGTETPIRSGMVGAPTSAQYVVIDAVNDIAAELGTSPAVVALAWIQGSGRVTSTLLGTSRLEQFENNLAALSLDLTAEQRAHLDEISKPALNFPAENNAALSQLAQNGGTTVDGRPSVLAPLLTASELRY
jgi:aryl-alcohol dehydrogenase-like predicted oxidoreductase